MIWCHGIIGMSIGFWRGVDERRGDYVVTSLESTSSKGLLISRRTCVAARKRMFCRLWPD